MSKTINNHQLTPGNIYFVRGNIIYSRVSRHTTDEERIKANQKRMHPIERNYTTITLENAKVIAADPNNPTLEEKYAYESLYKSSKQDVKGMCFSGTNKSKMLPTIRVINPDTGEYDQVKIDRELAVGLDVTVGMRVFKGQGNNGVSLDTVLVNEPIKFYGGDSAVMNSALKTLGVKFSDKVVDMTHEDEESSENIVTEETATKPDTTGEPPASENPFTSMETATTQNVPTEAAFEQVLADTAVTASSNPTPADNPFVSANDAFGAGGRKY